MLASVYAEVLAFFFLSLSRLTTAKKKKRGKIILPILSYHLVKWSFLGRTHAGAKFKCFADCGPKAH